MAKPVVVKVGGAFLDHPVAVTHLFSAIKTIKLERPVVLVHGGGNSVELLLSQLGLTTEKFNGLRVTPAEQIPYIVGALAGTANKQLCAKALASHMQPVGLTLFDGGSVHCEVTAPELHYVGTPKAASNAFLTNLLEQSYLPVVSSIGCSSKGELLNVNADQAATALAQLLDADLYLLSDVSGVLDADKQLLPSLSAQQGDSLIAKDVIQHGMLVKVKAAQTAADSLQRSVIIGSWNEVDSLISHAIAPDSVSFGTRVYPTQQHS